MKIGDKVTHSSPHVGVIERIVGNQAYVRWHKGFATWHDLTSLQHA